MGAETGQTAHVWTLRSPFAGRRSPQADTGDRKKLQRATKPNVPKTFGSRVR